jgi:hypothetical protein
LLHRGRSASSFFLLVAKQVSQDLAMALFKEALKAGWFNGTR